ncbi:hypothetical protein ROS62_01390 [Streptomyces sp. DSM 41972]|uniref:Uncharacterized protein n=1 Tax=Streptomyces althioticus subsp. attaecolombicae TaxID=3075534 RepID=A0ABU3HSD7_9ACTN|nr:hypothetical protein [Streptomyces sp. DSM 41972]SCD82121.1 hypothetical protein GA0115238_126712 [Streptomyces sp. di50b]SCD99508.1 hypothetical protein GA0115245_118412 [Streptomyces sp. di188]
MRQTRIEKTRQPARYRRYTDETAAFPESLDPRDPDIVRAKRLRAADSRLRGGNRTDGA